MDNDLLLTNALLLPVADGLPAQIDCGFVAINGGRITALGAMADLSAAISGRRVIDAAGRLVMPGLVNAHNHAAMTLFRGLADDLPLMTWLQEHIFPAEARFVNEEMVYWCTKLAAAEMLMGGTTTVADGYFHEDAAAQAFVESGMRAVAAQGVIDFPAPGVPDPARNIEAAEGYIEKWRGKCQRLTPAVFCHSPYTCSPETVRRAKELARRHDVPFFIHLAETRDEVLQIRERENASPVQYLAGLGVLDARSVAVHCVWLEREDLDILQRAGAAVVTCPESNMKLASGIAPVKEMLDRGMILGLGTDGCASNNDLDLFREMDMCAKLHKVHHQDPTVLPATQVLKMATLGGARALGLDHLTGSLEPGKRADLIIINLRSPRLTPFHNSSLLVYAAAAADVETVIIDGELVMEDRKLLTFGAAEAMEQVTALARLVTAAT